MYFVCLGALCGQSHGTLFTFTFKSFSRRSYPERLMTVRLNELYFSENTCKSVQFDQNTHSRSVNVGNIPFVNRIDVC
jgi:hypothetical protein